MSKEYFGIANVEHWLYINTEFGSRNFANYVEGEDCI